MEGDTIISNTRTAKNNLITKNFISDGIRTSVISTEDEAKILLHCQRNKRGSYNDCSLIPEICICNPVGTTVNCRCKYGQGPSRLMLPHNLLPQKHRNVWINPTNESPVAELDRGIYTACAWR